MVRATMKRNAKYLIRHTDGTYLIFGGDGWTNKRSLAEHLSLTEAKELLAIISDVIIVKA